MDKSNPESNFVPESQTKSDFPDRFKSKFQIGETGISQDYFNHMMVMDLDVLLQPNRYGMDVDKLKSKLVEKLDELKTYTEYTVEEATRYSIRPEDFINQNNNDGIKKLDQIVADMKNLGNSPEKLDVQEMLNLIYQGALIIYGNKSEAVLKKRFGIK